MLNLTSKWVHPQSGSRGLPRDLRSMGPPGSGGCSQIPGEDFYRGDFQPRHGIPRIGRGRDLHWGISHALARHTALIYGSDGGSSLPAAGSRGPISASRASRSAGSRSRSAVPCSRAHRRTLRHAGTSWPAGVHPGLVRRGLLRLGGVGGRARTRTVRGAGKAATAPRPPPPGGRLRRRLPGSPSPGPQAWTPRLGRCPKGMCAPARASRQRRSGSHQVAQWPPS
jgi:hypothetical protein